MREPDAQVKCCEAFDAGTGQSVMLPVELLPTLTRSEHRHPQSERCPKGVPATENAKHLEHFAHLQMHPAVRGTAEDHLSPDTCL